MATATNTGLMTLAILLIAGTLICNTTQVSGQCGGSIIDLVSQCRQYVEKNGPTVPPSQGCCAVLRNFNVPCLCNLISNNLEKTVSIDKAIFVARSCGLNVPAGMKCGSVTVPPIARK